MKIAYFSLAGLPDFKEHGDFSILKEKSPCFMFVCQENSYCVIWNPPLLLHGINYKTLIDWQWKTTRCSKVFMIVFYL